MRRLSLILTGLLILALSGCGQNAQTPPPAAETPVTETPAETPAEDGNPTAEEPGREETMEMIFSVEGEAEVIPATLYRGQGYSIYIPDEGWRLERDVEDNSLEETWESVLNDDVQLSVFQCQKFSDTTAAQIHSQFAAGCGYVFEDLMGGELGDPLTGVDEDGDFLCFMMAEGTDTVYLIYWEYPAEAAEGFGVRLGQMAGTFEVME